MMKQRLHLLIKHNINTYFLMAYFMLGIELGKGIQT